MFYTTSLKDITPNMLSGFFVGWPNPPSPEVHLDLLKKSYATVIAINKEENEVVGFITAVSDGVLSAYIPFLEVLPPYQGNGIGQELVKLMLKELNNIYMIDLMCDEQLQNFYKNKGFSAAYGMILRNYQFQSGKI